LSNLDRKRWVAEELYIRENYGYYTMSDNTVKLLLSTSGKSYKYANDPPNYEILMNSDYLNEFCYFPLVYGSEQEN
jgi:hypothetical protein